jgi:hypothetical protein
MSPEFLGSNQNPGLFAGREHHSFSFNSRFWVEPNSSLLQDDRSMTKDVANVHGGVISNGYTLTINSCKG